MSFKEWREWYKSLHWTRQWFVILNLIRPITDNFYELKQVSIVLSPLYIIGGLTPIFVVASMTNKHFERSQPSALDTPFANRRYSNSRAILGRALRGPAIPHNNYNQIAIPHNNRTAIPQSSYYI